MPLIVNKSGHLTFKMTSHCTKFKRNVMQSDRVLTFVILWRRQHTLYDLKYCFSQSESAFQPELIYFKICLLNVDKILIKYIATFLKYKLYLGESKTKWHRSRLAEAFHVFDPRPKITGISRQLTCICLSCDIISLVTLLISIIERTSVQIWSWYHDKMDYSKQ